MPGRLVRSQTAQRVAVLLGSREGRKHLGAYGWKSGMPVIMTQPTEKLDDVMGLVSVHQGPVLVALTDPRTDVLKFLHISENSPALEVVKESDPGCLIGDLFHDAEHCGMKTFRVKYWKHSAVAHAIPFFADNELAKPFRTPASSAI